MIRPLLIFAFALAQLGRVFAAEADAGKSASASSASAPAGSSKVGGLDLFDLTLAFIEVDPTEGSGLVSESADQAEPHQWLWQTTQRLRQQGKARIANLVYQIIKRGSKVGSSGEVEMIYPTEFEPPSYGETAPGATVPQIIPVAPTTFETRHLGICLTAEFAEETDVFGLPPKDGSQVLRLELRLTEHLLDRQIQQVLCEISQPVFHSVNVYSPLRVRKGWQLVHTSAVPHDRTQLDVQGKALEGVSSAPRPQLLIFAQLLPKPSSPVVSPEQLGLATHYFQSVEMDIETAATLLWTQADGAAVAASDSPYQRVKNWIKEGKARFVENGTTSLGAPKHHAVMEWIYPTRYETPSDPPTSLFSFPIKPEEREKWMIPSTAIMYETKNLGLQIETGVDEWQGEGRPSHSLLSLNWSSSQVLGANVYGSKSTVVEQHRFHEQKMNIDIAAFAEWTLLSLLPVPKDTEAAPRPAGNDGPAKAVTYLKGGKCRLLFMRSK